MHGSYKDGTEEQAERYEETSSTGGGGGGLSIFQTEPHNIRLKREKYENL